MTTSAIESPAPPLCCLTDDPATATALEAALGAFGIALERFDQPDERLARRLDECAALLLLDTGLLPEPAALAPLLDALRIAPERPPPRFVCLERSQDLRWRLAALRAGALASLPAAEPPEALAARLAALLAAPSDGMARILIVEDQPVAALFATRVLNKAGMRTHWVADPLQLLEALESFAPDLVLMDLHLPGATGIELTGIVREQERFASLPIVFLSGELDPALQLDALRIGGDDFLAKPVSPARLLDCVNQRLRLARLRQRAPAGMAAAARSGPADREHLLHRLDQLIGQGGSAGAAAWMLMGLELADDPSAAAALTQAMPALLEDTALAAPLGANTFALLVRRDPARSADEQSTVLSQTLRQSLARTCPAARLGSGWCPLGAGGGDALTLVSRAVKAARLALRRGQARALSYARERARPVVTDGAAPILAAIEGRRLRLLYEPILALRRQPMARYEAKPRLLAADGELLPPAEFLPLARTAGLIPLIDDWILDTALAALQERQAAGQTVHLFVHQSGAAIARPDWIEDLRDRINRRDLIRQRPIVQFEARELEPQLELARDRARQLARLGIRICLNGIGHDELGQQVLAIPSDFVRLAPQSVRSLSPLALGRLIQQAREGGRQIIGGGVDDPQTVARLFGAGADLLQGPFVRPPGEAMDFDFANVAATV